MRARMTRHRKTIVVVAAATALAGCGEKTPSPVRTPAAAKSTPAHRSAPLVYVWRNFEVTGIPEEMTIYRDGSVRYRYLLHTQHGIETQTEHLRPPALRAFRRLVRRVDLRHADASRLEPPRDGYRYIIRHGGVTGTAVDGHLHGAMRRLVVRLGAQLDRLQSKSL